MTPTTSTPVEDLVYLDADRDGDVIEVRRSGTGEGYMIEAPNSYAMDLAAMVDLRDALTAEIERAR